MPSRFISRTTFGCFSIKLAFHRPHLLPKLAEPADPWWEVSHLNLSSVSPGGVAPVGEGHVARPHPVQGAHQRQAAPNCVARLNPNLSLVKVASHVHGRMRTDQAGNFPLPSCLLNVGHACCPVQVVGVASHKLPDDINLTNSLLDTAPTIV